jgi:hypothetical protein
MELAIGIVSTLYSVCIILNSLTIRRLQKRIDYLELAERDNKEHIRIVYDEIFRKEQE